MMWGLMSSGTQCLGGDDDVGLNVFGDTVPWW